MDPGYHGRYAPMDKMLFNNIFLPPPPPYSADPSSSNFQFTLLDLGSHKALGWSRPLFFPKFWSTHIPPTPFRSFLSVLKGSRPSSIWYYLVVSSRTLITIVVILNSSTPLYHSPRTWSPEFHRAFWLVRSLQTKEKAKVSDVHFQLFNFFISDFTQCK